MKNLSVAEGLFVEIEYVLSEAGPEGEVLEECPAEQAFGFKIGSGDVLPAFEKALEGKKVGEPFDFVIPCEKHMERQRLMLSTTFQSKCLRLAESLTLKRFNQGR